MYVSLREVLSLAWWRIHKHSICETTQQRNLIPKSHQTAMCLFIHSVDKHMQLYAVE